MTDKNKEVTEATPAQQLIFLAKANYDFARTMDSSYIAIPKHGPKITSSLKSGRGAFANELTDKYYRATGKIPKKHQLDDIARILESEIFRSDPVRTYVRVAKIAGEIFVDLGDKTGRCVKIDSTGWKVIDEPPVLFKRTALTSPLPTPQLGGSLDSIFEIVNIPPDRRSLYKGFLVSTLWEDISKPILALNGEQGSGKSKTTTFTSQLIDPSPAPIRKSPSDKDAWTITASGSYIVPLDNLSRIPEWLSDSLCRASTGDADPRRELYTDGDLVVHSFRRVVIINGINLSDTRDDLSDRLIVLNLPILDGATRLLDEELNSKWEKEHPFILGALFSLTSRVLAELPNTSKVELPRMADFGRILTVLDRINGTNSFNEYVEDLNVNAINAIDSNPFLKRLAVVITSEWTGSANDLLGVIGWDPGFGKYSDWPQSTKEVTELLKRSAPTLRKAGWDVENLGSANQRKVTVWRIAAPPKGTRV